MGEVPILEMEYFLTKRLISPLCLRRPGKKLPMIIFRCARITAHSRKIWMCLQTAFDSSVVPVDVAECSMGRSGSRLPADPDASGHQHPQTAGSLAIGIHASLQQFLLSRQPLIALFQTRLRQRCSSGSTSSTSRAGAPPPLPRRRGTGASTARRCEPAPFGGNPHRPT